ncbi:MAG: hypothetical protein AMXMBFR52_04100 [Burkholderiales bacterium]
MHGFAVGKKDDAKPSILCLGNPTPCADPAVCLSHLELGRESDALDPAIVDDRTIRPFSSANTGLARFARSCFWFPTRSTVISPRASKARFWERSDPKRETTSRSQGARARPPPPYFRCLNFLSAAICAIAAASSACAFA